MELEDRVVVVTGGGNGIGRALVDAFDAAGARGIVVADLDGDWAQRAAEAVDGLAIEADVGDPDHVAAIVSATEAAYGPIDVFCSNAGYADSGGLDQSPTEWERITRVNLLSHVWAARAVVPSMVERGGGYLLQTLSAAALITGPSPPGYTMTKHGGLGFAEWLTLNYGDLGVRVSCLCPNAVYTGLFGRSPDDGVTEAPDGGGLGDLLMPEEVAATVLEAMTTSEPFLILPHERVGRSFARKGEDYQGWIDHTHERLARLRLPGS